ncbi:MAG: hypothetical protein LW712_15435 [Burkholderiaceae bacterium]|jgi:hypothetical protein|nr:hypothetical protein [Burkholderiaceae bacterium]
MTDEFHGQGGSYVIDPETGRRALVERTQEAERPQPDPQPTTPAAEPGQE